MNKIYTSFLKLLALILLVPVLSQAQITSLESFDSPIFPPFGWNTGKIAPSSDVENYVQRVTAAINPAGTPATTRSGAGMVRYRNAEITVAGEKAFLASRPFDMTNIPVAGSVGTFWMYRDNLNTAADSLSLYLNDSALINYSGGVPVSCQNLKIDQLTGPINNNNVINRYYNYAPIGTPAGGSWQQYQFTIPNTWNTTNVCLVFVFTNRRTGATAPASIYIDDVTVTTYPKPQTFINTAMVYQNTSVIPQGSTDNMIFGITVEVDGGDTLAANAFRVDSLQFTTIGSTNAGGDVQNAKIWWTGGSSNWNGTANATQIGGTFANLSNTYYSFIPPNSFRLRNGINYFWITYDVKASGVSTPGDCIDGEYVGVRLTKGGTNFYTTNAVTSSLPGCRPIDVAYCGGSTPTYSVGTSWLGGSYTNNDYVQSVQLNGEVGYPVINNNLNCCGPPILPWGGGPAPFTNHPPDYEKFAAVAGKTTVLMAATPAKSYTITLQVGTWFSSNYIAAWIDFNHDGVFNNTLWSLGGEKLVQSGALNTNGTVSAVFQVPSGAYIGSTTLRVREVFANSAIDPCASATYGEVEDYTITIIPDCAATFGVPTYTKVWLGGFDDDWSNGLNWCPALPPTIAENTLIPGGSPRRPVIKDGTIATAKKLRIQGNDTLYVNAYGTGSLTIADSVIISNPLACMRVISTFADTALISTGTSVGTLPPNHITFAAAAKQRCQLVYTQADLLGKGLLPGDEIDSIYLLVTAATGTGAQNIYSNFTINYYYTTPSYSFPSPATLAPVSIAGGTIYTNPALNISAAGQLKFGLSTPIVWNGLANALVIDICYNKTTGGSHFNSYTQTLGTRRYLQSYTNSATAVPSCSLTPDIKYTGTATAASTTLTLVTQIQGLSVNIVPGMTVAGSGIAGGTTVVSIVTSTITLSAPTTGVVSGTLTFSITGINSAANTAVDRRPNLTFHFKREYQVFPINVAGHWNNSGTWIAGKSTVTFNGSINQHIDGNNFSTFKNLRVNTPATTNTVGVWKDVTVTDTLTLTKGRLLLNGNPTVPRSLSLLSNTGLQGALSYVSGSGMMVSENTPPNYGSFRWQIGAPVSYPQTYVIPLATTTGVQIPFDYKLNADSGDVTIATYNTAPNNTPIPTGVSDIYQNTWFAPPMTDNSPNMVDRFWQVDESGTTTDRDFTFRFSAAAPNENAAAGTGPYRAQVYDPSLNWGWPFIIGQTNPVANAVMVPAVNFTNTWALVKRDQPLPIELLDFKAKAHNDKAVNCEWTTAAEKNNDYFTVERSLDGKSFEAVGKVKGSGTTNESHAYSLVDNSPYRGLSYYRLRQTDFNNSTETFNMVAVDLSIPSSTVEVYPVPASNEVVFKVDNNISLEDAVLYIFDMTGRKVLTKKVSDLKGTETNLFILPLAGVQNGLYHFELRSDAQLLGNGKFICRK